MSPLWGLPGAVPQALIIRPLGAWLAKGIAPGEKPQRGDINIARGVAPGRLIRNRRWRSYVFESCRVLYIMRVEKVPKPVYSKKSSLALLRFDSCCVLHIMRLEKVPKSFY